MQIFLVGIGLLVVSYIRYKTPQPYLRIPLVVCPRCWTEGEIVERRMTPLIEHTCGYCQSTWSVS